MVDHAVIQSLRSLDFTSDLASHQYEKLAAMAQQLFFPAGQIIFREGDPDEFTYLIQEGQVAIDIRLPGKGKTTILTVGPGELLGWSSLFPAERKTASARTVRPTHALAFNAAQLRQTIQTDHDLGCVLLWRVAAVIAGRLKATRLQLLDIFAPAPVR